MNLRIFYKFTVVMWKNEKSTLTKNIRKIDTLVTSLGKNVDSTKCFKKKRESKFLQCGKVFTLTKINFVKSTIYIVNSLVKPLLSRKFCQKSMRVNFHNFHTVSMAHTVRKNETFTFTLTTITESFFRQIN